MTTSMDQGIVRRWAVAGVQPIPAEEGFTMLEQALAKELPYVAIIPGDWASIQRASGPSHGSGRYADLIQASQSSKVAPDGIAARLRIAAPEARRTMLMSFLRDRLRRTLGLEASFAIDSHQPLNELGIDSLMALELKNALSSELDLPLSATLIFEYPTLDALCTFLTSATGTEQPLQPKILEPVTSADRDLESVLAEIESLPEAQAKEYADR
jgi:acyl carrier protein